MLVAIGLVVVVVCAVSQAAGATVIPALAIPVALAATLAVMELLGYSLDNLTLMALTVAIGFVVDDAVIMIENIMRLMEGGDETAAGGAAWRPADRLHRAVDHCRAGRGADPRAVHAGRGRPLFPRIRRHAGGGDRCLRAGVAQPDADAVQPLFARLRPDDRLRRKSWLLRGYMRGLGWVLRHRALTVAATLTVTAASVFLYLDMPKGFMPTQDTGVIYVRTITMSNISFTAMSALQRSVSDAILQDPAVDGLNSYIGTDNGDGAEQRRDAGGIEAAGSP